MTDWTTQLNQLKFKDFPELFGGLSVPLPASLSGTYRGSFVGPGWLRALAGPALLVSGLGGWWGKIFREDGAAVNLVQKAGQIEERFAMRLVSTTSAIDGKPTLALIYAQDNPFPWPHIVDELRQLDAEALLGPP